MKVNKHYAKMNNYNYIFEEMKVKGDFHPALYKIMMVNKFLSKHIFEENDILIFLDADAWIFNPVMLKKLLISLPLSKHGIFSRDPYIKKNTYINSGSFIIRINQYTKKMYSLLEKQARENRSYSWQWPYDQWYISNYVFENKEDFLIYKPDITNTPIGKIIRHSWIKDFSTCYIQQNHNNFDLKEYIDREPFPNKQKNGYEYKTHKSKSKPVPNKQKSCYEYFSLPKTRKSKSESNSFLKLLILSPVILIGIILLTYLVIKNRK